MDLWDNVDLLGDRPVLLEHEIELLLIQNRFSVRDQQVPDRQSGSILLTNHRIIWKCSLPALKPVAIALSQSLIERFEAKSGFLKSSPKVILYLRDKSQQSIFHPSSKVGTSESWNCRICSEANKSISLKCATCGISRETAKNKEWKCAVCTFVNSSEHECEMCGTKRANQSLPSPVSSVTSSPSPLASSLKIVKLSFRDGGHSNFAAHLQMTMQKCEWRAMEAKLLADQQKRNVLGVAGLLHRVDLSQKESERDLSTAFTDLDALMAKAGDLVQVASSLSARLAAVESSQEGLDDSQDKEFRRMISDLGLSSGSFSSALNKDTAGSAYHTELASQLARFAEQYFEKKQLCLAPLPDVYCIFNRIRGTPLVSPDDLSRALSIIDNSKFSIRQLNSGLLVLQSAALANSLLYERIADQASNGIDAVQFAAMEHLPLSLALELLCEADLSGSLCRDETASTTRYYPNLIVSA